MNRFIVIIAAVVFCSTVSVQAQEPVKPSSNSSTFIEDGVDLIKPARTYKHDRITVVSPKQPGWIKLHADKAETAFEKNTESDLLYAGIKTIKTKPFETPNERLAGWEALKQEELGKLKQDSLHFYNAKFKGEMCLQYDGIFPVEKTWFSSKFAYFNLKGFVCSISDAKDSAVQIEFTNYSNTRGFTEDLNTLSDEFFKKLKFPKRK